MLASRVFSWKNFILHIHLVLASQALLFNLFDGHLQILGWIRKYFYVFANPYRRICESQQ